MRRYSAEAIGTFGVVFTGCGASLIGGQKLGDPGVALAFGLALAAMLFAAGPISGGHFNPAVTAAMAVTRRLAWRDVPGYIAAQLGGGVLGAAAAITMAEGRPGGAPRAAESIANGYGRLSPGYYGLGSALIAEVVLTALFVFVYLGVAPPPAAAPSSTRAPAPPSAALLPLAAGLAYTLIHLVGFQVTRLAANPARALGPALLAGGLPLAQVWLFFVAPIAGGVLAAAAHRLLHAPALAAKPVDVGAPR
jgi:aquaporin Z